MVPRVVKVNIVNLEWEEEGASIGETVLREDENYGSWGPMETRFHIG